VRATERKARNDNLERARRALVSLFSFSGELGIKAVTGPLLLLLTSSVVALFLVPLGASYWVLSGLILVSLASVATRRLRQARLGWGWILIGIVPFVGWVALAVLLAIDRQKATPESLARRMVVILASFLTVLLLSTSVSIKTVDADLALRAAGAWQAQQESSQDAELQSAQDADALEAQRLAEAEALEIQRQKEADAAQAEREAELEDLERRGDAASQANQSDIDATFDQLVASLRVEPEFIGGYDRSLFPHWIDASGNGCNARQEVLIAESLTPVSVGARCSITGGTWYSHFDGLTFTESSKLDVDHFIPLAEAWRSGAHQWDRGTRTRFANDLGYSMSLIAVSASSNRSKGDRDVAGWMPPNRAFTCEYTYSWAKAKVRWDLAVDESELSALKRNWSGCSESDLILQSLTSQAPVGFAAPGTPPQQQPPASQPVIPGECVNINTAPSTDLTRIIHIGPARAAALESLRPFVDVDDLVRIDGIGPSRLADIKAEGLACVP